MKIKFATKIYHPNIDDDGSICVVLLKSDVWKPATKLVDVLISIADLLSHPVPEDALQPSIAELYTTKPAEFKKNAADWTKKYATAK